MKEDVIYYLDDDSFDKYVESNINIKFKDDLHHVMHIDENLCCMIEGNIWDSVINNSSIPF